MIIPNYFYIIILKILIRMFFPTAVPGASQTSLYYDYPNGQMGASDGYIPYYPYLNLSYNAAAAAASQDRL